MWVAVVVLYFRTLAKSWELAVLSRCAENDRLLLNHGQEDRVPKKGDKDDFSNTTFART